MTYDPARFVTHAAWGDALTPDPRLTVAEWADAHRMLSTISSAEAGPWRTSRTPYLREIMDALSVTSPIVRVVFAKGAQVGGTEAGNNWIGYVIAHAPGPMLCLMPTDSTAEGNVRTRIDPLIDSTPAIRDKVPRRGSKEGGNTLDRKDFPGGVLNIRGANAPANLRSLPIRYLFLDEVDAYEFDLDGEGDPIALAQARARTFGRSRKEFEVSTPTIEGTSRIAASYEATDQRRYFVPCPHCGEYQTIEWPRIKWDSDTSAPYLACEPNGCAIEERHKPRMLSAGEWRATAECSDPTVRGYHLSALYSPLGWYSWAQARDDFLTAKREKNEAKLKTWVNTVLGETWKEAGEAPDWELLYARRESYASNWVPAGGLVLTGAVDVQKDRLELEIQAWGPRLEHWTIDRRMLPGDPAVLDGERSPWTALSAVLSESWPHELGGRIAIGVLAVDTGAETQSAYAWCRSQGPGRVMAIKGSDALSTIISTPRPVDIQRNGQTIRNGVMLWQVGVSVIKSEIYGWLRQRRSESDEIKPTGWAHWPDSLDQEHFKQLTSEVLRTKVDKKGYRKRFWSQIRDRNEALDLSVYNRAAAAQLGVDRWTDERWDRLRAELDVGLTPKAAREATPPSTGRMKIRRKPSSGYW
jgi:phage terminase large subunit GpA-like protein